MKLDVRPVHKGAAERAQDKRVPGQKGARKKGAGPKGRQAKIIQGANCRHCQISFTPEDYNPIVSWATVIKQKILDYNSIVQHYNIALLHDYMFSYLHWPGTGSYVVYSCGIRRSLSDCG